MQSGVSAYRFVINGKYAFVALSQRTARHALQRVLAMEEQMMTKQKEENKQRQAVFQNLPGLGRSWRHNTGLMAAAGRPPENAGCQKA